MENNPLCGGVMQPDANPSYFNPMKLIVFQ